MHGLRSRKGKCKMKKEMIFELRQADLRKGVARELREIGREVREGDGWVYSPGSVPVLLVAHMDTVHKNQPKIRTSADGGVWFADEGIGGDDRCGVYMVLETIRKHNCHVLFTEDEECGGVGAEKFAKQKMEMDLKFMIEFDRKGNNDAVFYNCGNDEFEQFVLKYGFETANGSFSDISILAPQFGVAAVNLSSGYYFPHTNHEIVVWADVERVLRLTDAMLRDVPTVDKFEYVEASYDYGYGWNWEWNSSFYPNEDCELKKVSPFDGYLKWDDGTLEEVASEDMMFFIGEDSGLYMDYGGYLTPVKIATAYTHNSTIATYDESCSFEDYVSCEPWYENEEEI